MSLYVGVLQAARLQTEYENKLVSMYRGHRDILDEPSIRDTYRLHLMNSTISAIGISKFLGANYFTLALLRKSHNAYLGAQKELQNEVDAFYVQEQQQVLALAELQDDLEKMIASSEELIPQLPSSVNASSLAQPIKKIRAILDNLWK